MKKIKHISIASIIGLVLLIFASCDDSSELFNVSANPNAAVLADLNFTMIELDAVNTSNPAVTLNWQSANYEQQTSINYSIEFASDVDFTAPVVASSITGQTSITLSVNEINAAAGNSGLNPFEWATLYVRVVSSIGSQNGLPIPSNTIQFEVYPFYNYVFSDYYLVGDATAPGWNNNNNNPALFRDPTDSNVFYYTGFWAENGHFKVLETKGLWQPQFGTDDGATVGNNPGGGTDPERFPYGGGNGIPAGFHTFKINFASNTFTFESFDASGAVSPASITLQGSSSANISMSPLSFDGHIWYATAVRLIPGELSFVTDSNSSWGGSTSFSGVATDGGSAVPIIVEDDYDVWFNDLTGRYIFIPLNL